VIITNVVGKTSFVQNVVIAQTSAANQNAVIETASSSEYAIDASTQATVQRLDRTPEAFARACSRASAEQLRSRCRSKNGNQRTDIADEIDRQIPTHSYHARNRNINYAISCAELLQAEIMTYEAQANGIKLLAQLEEDLQYL
jgi:hypothetical protein